MKALQHPRTRFYINLIAAIGVFLTQRCDEFVTIPGPNTQLDQAKIFRTEDTALSAMASIYLKLSQNIQSFAGGAHSSVTVFEGLYADELTSYLTATSSGYDFYFNSVTPESALVSSTWGSAYKVIYESNRLIEGLNASTSISEGVKSQLLGEAIFVRAFCHFYLVNLFGDIPLVTTSDYATNSSIPRTPVEKVYAKITYDLKEAKQLLSDEYPSEGRVRINKGAATAMLARVYLYTGEYANAESEASEVIGKINQYNIENNLDNVFLAASDEAIWQIMPQGGLSDYTYEGSLFILRAQPTVYALRNSLYTAFDEGDLRRDHWIGFVISESGITTWYFPYKYKQNHLNGTGGEYSMVLRLAEQYLIRAEARAMQKKLIGDNSAQTDINVIRNRAGLPNTTALSEQEMLAAIEQERRLELFTEWGHRFFDLKRTGRLDEVLGATKPNWNSTDALLPIPLNEMLNNQNLKPQNPGY